MRKISHLTPTYVANRLLLAQYQRHEPDAPWLTQTAVSVLSDWLRPTDVGLEWGSGRSTVWFAKRTASLHSIEHHPGWYARVKNMLSDAAVSKQVNYELHEDGIENSPTCSYVRAAEAVADASVDYCLIDGVARDFCAQRSLNKLKPGGLLIIDNINIYCPQPAPRAPQSRLPRDGFASPIWETVIESLADWRSIWTSNGVSDTAFWVKPCR